MSGLLAISSPNASNVGVTRFLSYDPNILSTRGYIKAGGDDATQLNGSNLLSSAEALTTFCAWHDDSPRVAMTTVQSKHTIPVHQSDSLLIGTGVEKTMPHIIGNDFSFKAKEDGTVYDINEKTGIMILKYKSGKYDALELGNTVEKNGGGGFFITNKKVTELKKGSKFKAKDIIASNKDYFTNEGNQSEYKVGTLAKVSISSGYYTFEDSSIVSENLSKKMTSDITMKSELVLGKNATIDYIVKAGDHVEVADKLATFEESYSDLDTNALLSKIGAEFKEDIEELSKNTKTSKYSGEIVDIQVFYTVPFEELSPSIQKVINNINKKEKDRQKLLKTYFPDGNHELNTRPVEYVKTDDGKVNGVEVGEGVLIRFFIKHADIMGIGDKITFYSAIKSIIQQVIPDDECMYSDFRKDELIDGVHPTISYLARMTASVPLNLYGNKIMVETKRALQEIYGVPLKLNRKK